MVSQDFPYSPNVVLLTLVLGLLLLIPVAIAVVVFGTFYFLALAALKAQEYYQRHLLDEQREAEIDWADTPYDGYTRKYWKGAVISAMSPPLLFATYISYITLVIPNYGETLELGVTLSETIGLGLGIGLLASLPICLVSFSYFASEDRAVLHYATGEESMASTTIICLVTIVTGGLYSYFYIYDRMSRHSPTD